MKHRAPPPAGVLSKAKRYPARIIGVSFAMLLVLYVCGSAVGQFVSDDEPTATPSAGGIADDLAATLSDSAPASPSPSPSRTVKPTPRPTRGNPQSTVKRTRPSTRKDVHPGGSCKTAGAVGRTSTGKLVVCKRSAEDDRLRWRTA